MLQRLPGEYSKRLTANFAGDDALTCGFAAVNALGGHTQQSVNDRRSAARGEINSHSQLLTTAMIMNYQVGQTISNTIMRRGPKSAVDESPLPFNPKGTPSQQFADFCRQFILVPSGSDALSPLIIREWQRELVASVFDADPMPRIAAWCLPRGNGKSSLAAAISIWNLFCGGEAATVICVAVDERQAQIVFNIAARMVALSPALQGRCQVYKEKILIPARGASFACLPASAPALEGLNYTLCIADEIGRIDREVWEVVALAAGKRERSVLLGIGTPGPTPDNVLASLRAYAVEHPDDCSQVYREHSAAGFEGHSADCEHCWALANPALDDFLYRDAMRALLPPKMDEARFRRARLCQHVTGSSDPILPPGLWASLSTGQPIPDGSDVVLAFDGAYSGTDCTVLLAATVAKQPHVDVLGVSPATVMGPV